MRSRPCLAVAVALPLVVTSLAGAASADELHFETFRFGQRAHGMGGAVMALPGEPEATAMDLIKDEEPAAEDPAAAPADPVVPAEASPAPVIAPPEP